MILLLVNKIIESGYPYGMKGEVMKGGKDGGKESYVRHKCLIFLFLFFCENASGKKRNTSVVNKKYK